MRDSDAILFSKEDAQGAEKTLKSVEAPNAALILFNTTDSDVAGQASLTYIAILYKEKNKRERAM